MDEKKILVILTMSYPYGKKETYLDNEVGYIEGFEKVIIVPCFPVENGIRNCKIKEVICTKHSDRLLKKSINLLLDIEFWKEIFYIIIHKNHKIKCIKKLLWFTLRCKSVEQQIYASLKGEIRDNLKIYIYSYWMTEPAFLGAKLKRKLKRSIFVTRCHGYDVYEYRNAIKYIPYRNFIFKSVDKIFTISKNGENYLKDNYECLREKVIVSYLGTEKLSLPSFRMDKKKYLKIVTCSNMVEVKRIDRIIDTLAKIDEYKIEWDHYGDGELFDELLLSAKKSLGDKNNIKFNFWGRIDNKDILAKYIEEKYDLFINVSESEGLPVSIMEAMSCGIPAIATDVGGTSEIIEEGKNGFLLNEKFVVDELEKYLSFYFYLDEKKKTEFRMNAFQSWNDNFNAERNYKLFFVKLLNI